MEGLVAKRSKISFDPKAFLSKVNGGRAVSDYREDQIVDLLQIEWVKWGGFSQVECDSKGFFVNVTVTSSRHVCAHAKIDQDEAPER